MALFLRVGNPALMVPSVVAPQVPSGRATLGGWHFGEPQGCAAVLWIQGLRAIIKCFPKSGRNRTRARRTRGHPGPFDSQHKYIRML